MGWLKMMELGESSLLVPDPVDPDHPVLGGEDFLEVLQGDVLLANVHIPHPVPSSTPKSCGRGVCKAIVAQLVHQALGQSLQNTSHLHGCSQAVGDGAAGRQNTPLQIRSVEEV